MGILLFLKEILVVCNDVLIVLHIYTHVCVYWCAYFTPVFPTGADGEGVRCPNLWWQLYEWGFLIPTMYLHTVGLQVKCLSIKKWCTDTAEWLGVSSWCRVHPLCHFPGRIPSHFVPLTWKRLNTACRTNSCPPSTNSRSTMPSLPKNAISKTFEFNLAVWYFSGKGDDVAYHLDDCCMVSGSSKYQTLTSCNNLALEAVILYWLFKQPACNCSSIPFDCRQATAERLHKSISSIAVHVDPCKIPTSHPTLPMAMHWLSHTSCFIFEILSALREDEGLPLQTCLPAILTHFWRSHTQLIFKSTIPH